MSEVDANEQSLLDQYGIVRVPADVFHFGGYRYTNASDAVAAARRQEARMRQPGGPSL